MTVSLIVWLAVIFASATGEARYGVFTEEGTCQSAVAQAREAGIFVSDCVRVEVPKPKNTNPAKSIKRSGA